MPDPSWGKRIGMVLVLRKGGGELEYVLHGHGHFMCSTWCCWVGKGVEERYVRCVKNTSVKWRRSEKVLDIRCAVKESFLNILRLIMLRDNCVKIRCRCLSKSDSSHIWFESEILFVGGYQIFFDI